MFSMDGLSYTVQKLRQASDSWIFVEIRRREEAAMK